MLQEKLKSTDGFWDEKDRERAVVANLEARIANLRGAAALAEKVLAIRGNAGWSEFVKAVEDCRSYRRQQLELTDESDSEMRILQGRCRELGAILALMKQTEVNHQALAAQLRFLEEERALYVKEDGKVKPKGATS